MLCLASALPCSAIGAAESQRSRVRGAVAGRTIGALTTRDKDHSQKNRLGQCSVRALQGVLGDAGTRIVMQLSSRRRRLTDPRPYGGRGLEAMLMK